MSARHPGANTPPPPSPTELARLRLGIALLALLGIAGLALLPLQGPHP